MSTEILDSLKKQSSNLSPQEKSALAKFLLEQAKQENVENLESDKTKQLQLEWLKENREKYDGQYVALDGNRLVGYGKTLREAAERAKQNGAKNPFLIRVFSEETVVSAGL